MTAGTPKKCRNGDGYQPPDAPNVATERTLPWAIQWAVQAQPVGAPEAGPVEAFTDGEVDGLVSADSHAVSSALLSGVFEAEVAFFPPGDGGVGDVGVAEDG